MPDPADLLTLATDVAHRAGRLLVERRPPGDLAVEAKSTPTDIVTAMDTAAERLIVTGLREERPSDAVLGEEGGSAAGRSGVRWVVDPVDGTVNYFYGIPAYAVSIAAEVDGDVLAGVVHNPATGETWTATAGGGAFLDGERVRVRDPVPLSQALLGTGFSYDAARRARDADVLRVVLPAVRDIRRAGAAALDLVAVACGRLDGFYERELHPWDLAAGGLVAREAGALVQGAHGRPPGADLVLAAPPGLFEPLHDLVVPLVTGAG